MKIFQINTVYNTGSTGRIVKELSNFVIAFGGSSYVAYGRGEHTGDKLYRVGRNLDMIIHGIGNLLFDNHGLMSKNATRRLISKIKNLDIDIYHLHNIHGYYANYPKLFNFLKMQNKHIVIFNSVGSSETVYSEPGIVIQKKLCKKLYRQ